MQKPRQHAPCGLGIAADLDDVVENVAVLIDSAPEVALLAIDRDNDFVMAPNVPPALRLGFQATGAIGAKFHRPTPDCFVGYDNAALEQHFLDEAYAQREPKVKPDGMCGGNRWCL